MWMFLGIIGSMYLLEVFINNYLFKNNPRQINITPSGFTKIPKALLELSNIGKDRDTAFENLTKEEQKKFEKIRQKFNEAVWCNLTHVVSHGLIHIQKLGNGYFQKESKDDPYLIREELGKLKDGRDLYYVLYRKDDGLLRGARLIGYLLKEGQLGERKEVTPLFEFPERLLRWRFFTKSLQKKYNLREDTFADYIDKDELGFSRNIYSVSFETENREGASFWFRIY